MEPERKLTSPGSLVVDAILMLFFFGFMYRILAPHVPSSDRRMILVWGLLTTACLTGVFWLCLQMFRVVFAAQRASRK